MQIISILWRKKNYIADNETIKSKVDLVESETTEFLDKVHAFAVSLTRPNAREWQNFIELMIYFEKIAVRKSYNLKSTKNVWCRFNTPHTNNPSKYSYESPILTNKKFQRFFQVSFRLKIVMNHWFWQIKNCKDFFKQDSVEEWIIRFFFSFFSENLKFFCDRSRFIAKLKPNDIYNISEIIKVIIEVYHWQNKMMLFRVLYMFFANFLYEWLEVSKKKIKFLHFVLHNSLKMRQAIKVLTFQKFRSSFGDKDRCVLIIFCPTPHAQTCINDIP